MIECEGTIEFYQVWWEDKMWGEDWIREVDLIGRSQIQDFLSDDDSFEVTSESENISADESLEEAFGIPPDSFHLVKDGFSPSPASGENLGSFPFDQDPFDSGNLQTLLAQKPGHIETAIADDNAADSVDWRPESSYCYSLTDDSLFTCEDSSSPEVSWSILGDHLSYVSFPDTKDNSPLFFKHDPLKIQSAKRKFFDAAHANEPNASTTFPAPYQLPADSKTDLFNATFLQSLEFVVTS